MKTHYKIVLISLVSAVLSQCSQDKGSVISGIQTSYMDTSVHPGDDFNEYANGVWLKNNPVPETESRWGSFNEISDRNMERLKSIVNEAASDLNAEKGTDRQLVGTFYRVAFDSAKANKDGLTPIKGYQERIAGIKGPDDLIKTFAAFHKMGISAGFSFYVTSDLKNSKMNTQYISQDGFNLPDKEYYFQPKHDSVRIKYVSHLKNMSSLLEQRTGTGFDAMVVYQVEKELAEKAMNSVERRDIYSQYNPMSFDSLKKTYSNINWDLYFSELGSPSFDKVIVEQTAFLAVLNKMITDRKIEDWKHYLNWQLVNETANSLSEDVAGLHFDFFSTVLRGTKKMKPRWKTALSATDAGLGEPLGKLFVEKYFNAEAKKKVNLLVDNLTTAYSERIEKLSWMSDATKKEAQKKLSKIIRKLGYPDKWNDHSKLEITDESYCKNILNCNVFEFNRMLEKIGKEVDRTEWGMSTPTVNAYYNPSINEIVFPAGIMQPPFFDANADDAANYGGIGAIIGHELTHGFDDQGSQFDGDGNMVNWWTPEDSTKFKQRTGLLVKQYSAYIGIDTIHVNGNLTLGENIADLGGLTMAYYAYKKSLNGKPSPVIDGLTGEQRLFLSWAQGWKNNIKPEAAQQRLATDPHSPPKYRILGPMSNMQEFYEAFGVTEKNKMYIPLSERSVIW
ncbi:MAG: M13 family metallopeptidase [Flavobacteriales bacterium]|nr:M13 family metallopeptidase [Flavobacteriales bacterium]